MKTISALTFDTKLDGWEKSRGFVKREVAMPVLDESKDSRDALCVLIEVNYAGVCGTDRGIWNREVFRELIHDSLKRERKTQRILGHEFVGKVIQAGSQVKNLYGIKEGDNVSGDSHITCGQCFQCRIGEQEVCQDQTILGIGIDGVFAEYIKIPAKNLWQADSTRIRPEIAAMFDPFGNAVHACSKVDLRGKRVAILGCGPIGMFAILLCRAFGAAKVVAADINTANLAMAKSLGAHETVFIENGSDPLLMNLINKLTYGKGVDIAFEMAGPNDSVNNALSITRKGGEVVLFGLKDGDFIIPRFNQIVIKGLTIYSVIGRKIFATWQTSQRMLSDKQNGIQDKIWRIILKGGKGTILQMALYSPKKIEEMMKRYPKILIKM
jgi:threonine 3-dehydrogenase